MRLEESTLSIVLWIEAHRDIGIVEGISSRGRATGIGSSAQRQRIGRERACRRDGIDGSISGARRASDAVAMMQLLLHGPLLDVVRELSGRHTIRAAVGAERERGERRKREKNQ